MHPFLLWLHIYFIDMSFPAQMEVSREVVLLAPQQLDTDRIVRLKCQTLKETGQPRLNLLRQYRSINPGQFDSLKAKFIQLLANVKEGDNPNIEQFMPLVLGVLEGTSGTVDPMLLLIDHFGHSIENIKIEDTVKERTKVLYYGVDKRKEMSVRQTDKKTLESMADLFDLKEIKQHRKICQGIRNYIKALKKFVKAVDASSEPIDISSDAYKAYVEFVKEELEFNQLKMPIQETMIDQNQQKVEIVASTPAKQKPEKKKEDTASTHKNKDKDQQQPNGNEENSKLKEKRVRKTKEEVEREKILKEQEKQAKKREKEQKERAKLEEKEREKAEKAEKQRQKQLEKERERKAKQQEKQAKQREKQQAKEAKERQRIQKQAQKRRIEEEKQKKNNPGASILKFLCKQRTEIGSPSKQDAMRDQSGDANPKAQSNDTTMAFLNHILSQNTPLSECKQAFFQNKMKDQASSFEPYYVNIVTHKSRLEFKNFLVTEERLRDYTEPHGQTQTGKYEDSSAEYEDLCGDMCSDIMSAEEEASEENSAIVPDGYFEIGQLSQQSKDDVIVNIDKGGEWYFSSPSHERAQTFQIYCLYDEILPITLSQPQQSNELPISMKCDLYKQIHGFYGTKDALIKALALIADKMPRSYLDNLIKQTTTKSGSQRIVKPEIIEYINEQKEGFSKELQEIKARRDEEIKLQARQRVNQKERQIERLILEEAGTYYIVDLLQFLREKGFKMTKRDLNSFIEGRVGPHWDDIRRRMKKMQVKEGEKINQYLKKDKELQDQNKSDAKKEAEGMDQDKMQPQ